MKFRDIGRLNFIVNATCFIIAAGLVALFLGSPVPALRTGFFCDDQSLRYPYYTNTISVTLLIVTSYIPVAILILILETVYGAQSARSINTTNRESSAVIVNGGVLAGAGAGAVVGASGGGAGGSGHSWIDRSWVEGLRSGFYRGLVQVLCLSYGNCICFDVTEIFKLSLGTFRPSFISACRPFPDVTSFPNCSEYLYVEDVVCQNTDEELMIDMRKSFLSGHASFVVYNMLFIMLYLQRRLPTTTPRLLVSMMQCVAAGYAIFVCSSRVFDNYHHPQDVYCGALLGAVFCWVAMFKICPPITRHRSRQEFDLLPRQGPKQGAQLQLTSIQTKE